MSVTKCENETLYYMKVLFKKLNKCNIYPDTVEHIVDRNFTELSSGVGFDT